MSASQVPTALCLPNEPRSLTEQVIRALANTDAFDEPTHVGEEHVITPAFDVEVRPHRYLITMRLPQFRHDEVAVAVTNHEVLIHGRHRGRADARGIDESQTFSKSVRLPNWIDPSSADAVFRDGTLQVSFLRTVQTGLRFVHVRTPDEVRDERR